MRDAKNQRGATLLITLLAMIVISMVAASGFLVGSAGVRATRNYRGASQVHYVAESGIAEALQIVNVPGILDFQQDILTEWTTLFGIGPKPFAPMPGYTYQVTPVVNLADPANLGTFMATATGPEGVTNTVVASINRVQFPVAPPGAVFLSSPTPVSPIIDPAASFLIDGKDYTLAGAAGTALPRPGIAARLEDQTALVMAALTPAQRALVQGTGYVAGPPVTPSVLTANVTPTPAQLDGIVDGLLELPSALTQLLSSILGILPIGSVLSPALVDFPNNLTVGLLGTLNATGLSVMQGDLDVRGTVVFKGQMVVRGTVRVRNGGSLTVYGSLWANNLRLEAGSSTVVRYSSEALGLASVANAGLQHLLPIQLTRLTDCAQVPSGVGGCP